MEKQPNFDRTSWIRSIIDSTLGELSRDFNHTDETKIDYLWWRANEMEANGELPEGLKAWDVYDYYLAFHEGE